MNGRRGFTLVEMAIVMVMMGIMVAIAVPRLRVSPGMRARAAARQVAQDLEIARSRALATKRASRMVFDAVAQTYVGYLDQDNDGVFAQSAAEMQALGAFGSKGPGDGVIFGRGGAPMVPGDAGAGAVTFPGSRIEFSTYGITQPLGTRGTVYVRDAQDPNTVAAVTVTPGAAMRVLLYNGGAWQ